MNKFELELRAHGGIEGLERCAAVGNDAPIRNVIHVAREEITRAANGATRRLKEAMATEDLYMRYLGVLGILSACSVHVLEEDRESIENAFTDACAKHPLVWRRILNRIEIEAKR